MAHGRCRSTSFCNWLGQFPHPSQTSVQRDDDKTLEDCEDINSKQLGGEGSLFKSGVCDVEHIYVVCSIKCESVNGSDMISMTGSDLMWSCVRSQWCSGDASWMMGI